jgi:succinyl-CoA synthetase alpha subunit
MSWKFDSRIIIQGIAESDRVSEYISQMKACGVEVLVGINSGEGVVTPIEIPIFDLVEDAIKEVGTIETSIIFAAPYQVLDVSLEAIASGVKQLIIVTPKIPPLDTIKLLKIAQANNISILGPGSSGIMIPEKLCLGTLQSEYFQAGNVGIIGYGKALIYEVAWVLNQVEMGQSMAISLGEDRIISFNLIQWLNLLDEDDATKAIVLIQSAQDIDHSSLEFVAKSMNKPVIYYVVGSQTPREQVFRQGVDILNNHLSSSVPATYSYRKMIASLKKTGTVIIANNPSEIPQLVKQILDN